MATTPLALEQNLVLNAGAGTGKTHSLMTVCLHVLGGARSDRPPLPPARLCVVTFTEKAAAQLRDRLRQRLDGLCEGSTQSLEPELRESFRELGQPFPAPGFWRVVREGLPGAQIGTFHALALRWLRRLSQAGTSEHAELLAEDDAQALQEECVERVVVERLEAGDSDVAQLCRELGYASVGWAGGLIDEVRGRLAEVREEGIAPESIAVGLPDAARAAWERHRTELLQAVRDARAADAAGRFRSVLEDLERGLPLLTLAEFDSRDGFPALASRAREGLSLQGQRNGLGEVLKRVKYGLLGHAPSRVLGLADLHAEWACAPLERALRGLVGAAGNRYARELRRRSLVDFTGLLKQVREVWRIDPDARKAAQERVGALLVDEFQDTNRTQLDLVTMLSEERSGGPRPVPLSDGPIVLPLEPAFLAIVGDRKQSIYEFRGADASLFEMVAKRMEAEGGKSVFLQRSFRSTPALLDFFNEGFRRWMVPQLDVQPYEVIFSPDDALQAVRPGLQDGAPARRLARAPAEGAVAERRAEAVALAAELRRLLTPNAASGPRDDGTPRALRGGDIAILFRRFTNVEIYRQALIEADVPHQVWRGRGFFAAPEVRDVEALLSLVCDPQDRTSFVAVLRSPFVALSDGALFALAHATGDLELRRALSLKTFPADLSADEAERLRRFHAAFVSACEQRETVSARTLLQMLFDETGYAAAAAAGPHAEQVLANLDKLLERAERRAREGAGSAPAFSAELRRLLSTPSREAQAELGDGLDPEAVQLLTVHQAKGLEWPVVVVADLNAGRFRRGGRVVMERTLGLALRAPVVASDSVSARFRSVNDALTRRQEAEEIRLFYVALTRARDQLIFSGEPNGQRRGGRGWEACVAGLRAPELQSRIEGVSWAGPAEVTAEAEPPSPSPAAIEALRQVVARVRMPPARAPEASSPLREASGPEGLRGGARSLRTLVDVADCPRRHRLLRAAPDAPIEGGAVLRAIFDGQGVIASAAPWHEALSVWLGSEHGTALIHGGGSLPHWNVRASVQVPRGEGPPLTVETTLAMVREDDAGAVLRAVVWVEALSSRAAALAHDVAEKATCTLAARGQRVEVRTLWNSRHPPLSNCDAGLVALELDAVSNDLEAAERGEPALRAQIVCQALGCEFIARCHHGFSP